MKIKVASRTSKLAIAQVEIVMNASGIKEYEIIKVKTKGDYQSEKGMIMFDKSNFVDEIDDIVLSGEADIGVHSGKDVPAKSYQNLATYHYDEGVNNNSFYKDILIFKDSEKPFFEPHMTVGTSSLRRKMQALHFLNAKNIENLNGNIDTRINLLNQGHFDCIILALAGCTRLNLNLNFGILNHLTPLAQGKIAVRLRHNSEEKWWYAKIKKLSDNRSEEYSLVNDFLNQIQADCHSAIAVDCQKHINNSFEMRVEVYGTKNFIKMNSNGVYDECLKQAVSSFRSNGGEELLNEHN
tara:strand:+ start:822 stop:1709 length:888 start_codon:yes stop_codon:yes gene_type:complete